MYVYPSYAGAPCRYTADLLRLQAARLHRVHSHGAMLSHITSPLLPHIGAWRVGLADHPDSEFAGYVVDRIQNGFHVGFDWAGSLRPAWRNMPSAAKHAEVIDQYVDGEQTSGRILGPFPKGTMPMCRSISWAWSLRATPRANGGL